VIGLHSCYRGINSDSAVTLSHWRWSDMFSETSVLYRVTRYKVPEDIINICIRLICCLGLRAGLDTVEKKESLLLPGNGPSAIQLVACLFGLSGHVSTTNQKLRFCSHVAWCYSLLYSACLIERCQYRSGNEELSLDVVQCWTNNYIRWMPSSGMWRHTALVTTDV
jgi:hypothetical protein